MSDSNTTFSDLKLIEPLQRALTKLGFEAPTDVQQQTIPVALQGVDMMVSAKTGSGKTAAFILPMLQRFIVDDQGSHLTKDRARDSGSDNDGFAARQKFIGTRGLILLPTRELALQTRDTLQKLAAFTQIKCGLIMGGEAYKHQVATIRRNPEVIIATPGRLVDHLNKGNIDFNDLEMLVLDEADRMLDMGFAEEMSQIIRSTSPARQTLLFSATLTHKGLHGLSDLMADPTRISVDSQKFGHSNIKQQRILADDDKHKEKLVVSLVKKQDAEQQAKQEQDASYQAGNILVFCNTRLQCQKLSSVLSYHKINSAYIHGELSQSERKQILSRFRDGKIRVLVATDLAARGLDIPDLDLVINFNVPHSGDEHTHRIGRTGRAGQQGRAITLVSELDWNLMSRVERYLKVRFEPLKLEGLHANYKGPKNLKKSGKIAGTKKTKKAKKANQGKFPKAKASKAKPKKAKATRTKK